MQNRPRARQQAGVDMSSRLPPQGVPLARRQGQTPVTNRGARISPGPDVGVTGVYIISVAARILDMHPQTLRKYERLGLINPDRTGGMLRLYSIEDLRKIMLIRHLMDNLGLNLAGVEFVLTLVDNLGGMRERLSAAAEGTSLIAAIDREMSQLLRNLSLPPEE